MLAVCYYQATNKKGGDAMGKTSTEVKSRYNDKVYARLSYMIPKELAAEFKTKCEAEGIPQRKIIIEAVEKFLGKK